MSAPISRGRFWVLLLATALAAGLTASLGAWQLGRAQTKLALEAQMAQQHVLVPLLNSDFDARAELDVPAEWLHRPAVLTGRWVEERTVFLDNRQMDGKVGFFVITPLKLADDGRWLLVQRGWVPRDFMDRSHLPEVFTPLGDITVVGRVASGPARVYELGASLPGRIRQNLLPAEAAQEWSATLFNASLVQTEPDGSPASDGLSRNWPQVASGVHKHYGYAFQWLALCTLIIGLYVWFQIIAPRRKRSL